MYILENKFLFFLAEDLDSPTNAILWFFVQYNPGCFVIGRAAFHIKIENVHSFTEMLEILTTNDIPNCIQKYNIQIQKYTPYFFERPDMVDFHVFETRLGVRLFFEKADEIRFGDRMFYTFNNVDFKYECFHTISLLSRDGPNEVLRKYYHRPFNLGNLPAEIIFSELWKLIASPFKKIKML